MGLLDQSAQARVADAVRAAESTTAGELVVVEVERSADYAAWRAFAALLVTVPLALEFAHLAPLWPVEAFFALQVPLGVILYLLLGAGPLLRLIVPQAILREAAEQRALRAFLEAGVSETRDRSGVLIFLSVAERRAIILADKGINDRVEKDEWQNDVNDLVSALRSGQPVDGLLRVIARIGGLLTQVFPRRSDDTNELADQVRRLD